MAVVALKGVLHLALSNGFHIAFTSSVLQDVLVSCALNESHHECISLGVCCGAGVFGESTPGTPSTLQHDPSGKKILSESNFQCKCKGRRSLIIGCPSEMVEQGSSHQQGLRLRFLLGLNEASIYLVQ